MSERELTFLFDSPEAIAKCLNCKKPECDNCLGGNCSVKKVHKQKIDHDVFMKLYNSGLNDREIAESLDVARKQVIDHRKEYDLPPKQPKGKLDPIRFIELYEQGLTDREIAKELGVNTQYICVYRNKHGFPSKHSSKRRKT